MSDVSNWHVRLNTPFAVPISNAGTAGHAINCDLTRTCPIVMTPDKYEVPSLTGSISLIGTTGVRPF